MLKTQQQQTSVKILLGAVLLVICVSMVITLVPGPVGDISNSPETLARVAGSDITQTEVQATLARVTQNQTIPSMLQGLYVRQVLDEIVFQRALEYEGGRLGIHVTPDEMAERIRLILPSAFTADNWSADRYTNEVQTRTGMTVPDFEDYVRQSMLEEKFRQLVTSGITVSDADVKQEYVRKNQKISIDYALIRPETLAPTINPSDSELMAYFSKNQAKYQIPEKRTGRYALLDLDQSRQKTQIPESDLMDYYNQHLADYKVPDRVHIEQILFKTIGKTDAEVAEIQKKAEDVLQEAKKSANFEDLAKKYSDDATKDKGGDVGWILKGQTVPAVENVAFSLPKGTVSDLVKTDYGFEIIKVVDKETAHTKSFDEERASIEMTLKDQKVTAQANDISNNMMTAIRQSNHQPIENVAKQFGLEVGDIPAVSVLDSSIGNLGTSQELRTYFFQLSPGELSTPLQIDKGYVIMTVTNIQPAHAATLAEVHDKVLADYRHDKSIDMAKMKADELAKAVQGGQPLDKAAKSLGLDVKKSDAFTRDGNVADLGPAKTFEPAFSMKVGQSSPAVADQGSWVVYSVATHDEPNMAELILQTDSIRQQLLQTKQDAAFQAFRDALEARLRNEGKLTISESAVKDFTRTS